MPIDAAVAAMRAVRTKGAKVHDEVLKAYAWAAVQAAENARLEDFQRGARLNDKPKMPDGTATELTECDGNPTDHKREASSVEKTGHARLQKDPG